MIFFYNCDNLVKLHEHQLIRELNLIHHLASIEVMEQQFSITLYQQTYNPCLSNDAPNRMINLDSFLNFVNANLSSCKICK